MAKKKSRFKAWMDAVQRAKGNQKIIVLLLGWIFAFTAHDPEEENEAE